jgi:glutamate-1-semialdehyde aminotransferase
MAEDAVGAWVSSDDLSWVDLVNGLGAVILGHQHPRVDEAIETQLRRGISFPLPTALEEKVARRLLDMLTWRKAESVRFGKNGADVTGAAVRLARKITGREEAWYAHYHGHHEWSMRLPPMNGGVPVDYPSLKVDPRKVIRADPAWTKDPPACVVLEAVDSSHPTGPSCDFHGLREWCDRVGSLLILDEMVTGFRMAPGGAAEYYRIEPDIACYGKAMANGMPLSAVVGPWEILRHFEDSVFFSTTHGGEALSLAAADATLQVIVEEHVPLRLGLMGEGILASATGSYGYPQRVMFRYSPKQLQAMVYAGVLTQGYANLSLALEKDTTARRRLFSAIHIAEMIGA